MKYHLELTGKHITYVLWYCPVTRSTSDIDIKLELPLGIKIPLGKLHLKFMEDDERV